MSTLFRLPAIVILFVLYAQTAVAAEQAPLSLSASLRLFWGLLIVLGIVLIVSALIRKRLLFLAGGNQGTITIVETRHLMPKKSLCLVRVRGREYLLGLGNDQISLIATLPIAKDPDPPDAGGFAQILSMTATGATPQPTADAHDRNH